LTPAGKIQRRNCWSRTFCSTSWVVVSSCNQRWSYHPVVLVILFSQASSFQELKLLLFLKKALLVKSIVSGGLVFWYSADEFTLCVASFETSFKGIPTIVALLEFK
jgi:hypothetical protein